MVRPLPAAPAPTRGPAALVHSANFEVEAETEPLAAQVSAWAEQAREAIARRWFGRTEPPWSSRARIRVPARHPGYFATEFSSDGGVAITLWAGDPHLQSTLRHEVCHALLHLHYPGQYLPRWLDEGLAVCCESPEEQRRLLAPLFESPRRFGLRQLFQLREYPEQVLLFYAQSYSVVDYLVRQHGERQVIRFLEASLILGTEEALRRELGYASIEELEEHWRRSLGPPGRKLDNWSSVHLYQNGTLEIEGRFFPDTASRRLLSQEES